jgi:hypothetical protein
MESRIPRSASHRFLESLVSSINNAGDISGFFVEGDPATRQVNYHGFVGTLAAVPEPASLAMLTLGVSGLALVNLARRVRKGAVRSEPHLSRSTVLAQGSGPNAPR